MSKKTQLSAEMKKKFEDDIEGALAETFVSSFGVGMPTVCHYAKMLLSPPTEKAVEYRKIRMLCIAASTQKHDNISGAEGKIKHIKEDFPLLIIDTQRDSSDSFNFTALRMIGHFFNSAAEHKLADTASKKAGNIVSGTGFTENEAGKLNKAAYESLSSEDKDLARKTKADLTKDQKAVLEGTYSLMQSKVTGVNEEAKKPMVPEKKLVVPVVTPTVPPTGVDGKDDKKKDGD